MLRSTEDELSLSLAPSGSSIQPVNVTAMAIKAKSDVIFFIKSSKIIVFLFVRNSFNQPL